MPFEAARQKYQDAKSALESWGSGLPTDALKSDASQFVQALLAALSNQLALTETLFNQFVSQNKGRFFGPVGPDIEQALLETRTWEDTETRLREKGLEGKLRQWRSDANKFLEVDVRFATQSLAYNLRGMPKELQGEVTTFVEAVRDEVMRETRQRLDELNRSFDATLQVASDDKIRQALDRSQVRAALAR